MEKFLGFDSLQWAGLSAIASGIYDILTLLLIGFAALQIYFARREAQINRTLTACDKYDLDPLLDEICRRLDIAKNSGDLVANPPKYRLDIYSVLNYLESIAIGVRHGLYCRKTVRAQMEPIIVGYVEEYIDSGLVFKASVTASKPTVSEDTYEHMIALVKRWSRVPWYKRFFGAGKPKI